MNHRLALDRDGEFEECAIGACENCGRLADFIDDPTSPGLYTIGYFDEKAEEYALDVPCDSGAWLREAHV